MVHPPQQMMQRMEYQNHFVLSVLFTDIVNPRSFFN